MCLCGTVVSSLSLTQEVLGSNPAVFLLIFNFFVTEFSGFSENIYIKLHWASQLASLTKSSKKIILDDIILTDF